LHSTRGGRWQIQHTTNLAAISAAHGYCTLLVDLDSQWSTSQYVLGTEAKSPEDKISDYYKQTLGFSLFSREPMDFVHDTDFENLFISPGHHDLRDIESKLQSKHKIYKLRDLLGKLSKEFDRIYIDTPPTFNFYSLSALIAADKALIPVDCDDFSRKALCALLANIQETQEDISEDLALEGIVVNQFQARANQPQRIVDALAEAGLPLFESYLCSSVKMRESHKLSELLIYLAGGHKLT
jgi:chromosome partitioning protein